MNKKVTALLVLICLISVSCSENVIRTTDTQQTTHSDKEIVQNAPEPREVKQKTAQVDTSYSTSASPPEPLMARQADSGVLTMQAKRERTGTVLVEAEYSAARYPGAHPVLPAISAPWNRESYDAIEENRFINSLNDPLSTFSIDVDTASYANIRRFIDGGQLPPRGAVRAEEMINYFTYDYPEPGPGQPFSVHAEVGQSPFHEDYRLVKIGLKARDIPAAQLPPSNLTFLIDVSGSMNRPNKLGLLKKSLKMLAGQLGSHDRVSIVVYAGSDRIVLDPTPGNEYDTIVQAVERLQSGGSTHASSGILTAYEMARKSFMPGGNNRVILASDGDFNVGVTSRDELQALIEKQRNKGIYLTVLGFGDTNYHDDTMEILADKGNGNYAYIDSLLEAKKVLIKERSSTLFALARDVKIQVEFNPSVVGAYRLIGYENRTLQDEDFQDDTKDAGEIGLGHTVTALYEVIPAGHRSIPGVDQLKYQRNTGTTELSSEMLTVKLRYKPEGKEVSTILTHTLKNETRSLDEASIDFRFAATVAGFSMLLSESPHAGTFTWAQCLEMAKQARGRDSEGYRAEFTRLVEMAEILQSQG